MIGRCLRRIRKIVLTTLLVGFLGATMVRLGPGFEVDVEDMDVRLSRASRDAIHARHAADRNIFAFYFRYVAGMLHGDLGTSRSLNQPVTRLIAERLPVTLGSLGYGVLGGLSLGFGLAFLTLVWRGPVYSIPAAVLSGICLSLPSALLALLFLWSGSSGRWAIALAVFPYVYRYSKNILSATYFSPHVVTAMAKGLSTSRILVMHVVMPAAPQLVTIVGISVTVAFTAAIPIEAICDSPGIGQLVWQAALGRDLPLLVGITMLVALMTLMVNGLADMFLEARAQR